MGTAVGRSVSCFIARLSDKSGAQFINAGNGHENQCTIICMISALSFTAAASAGEHKNMAQTAPAQSLNVDGVARPELWVML